MRRRPPPHDARGTSVVDLLFALGLVATLVALAVPQALAGIDRSRGLAAARYLASRMALARAQAAGGSATVALLLEDDASAGVRVRAIVDGNGNGVRTRDIDAGVDRQHGPAVHLSNLFPGVLVALAGDETDPETTGSGRALILSFTPLGTASSATVYLRARDGSRWAVRVLGATARTRVLRYAADTDSWVEAF